MNTADPHEAEVPDDELMASGDVPNIIVYEDRVYDLLEWGEGTAVYVLTSSYHLKS